MIRPSRDSLIVLGILTVIVVTYMAVIHRWQSNSLDGVRGRIAEGERLLQANGQKATHVPAMIRQVERMKQRFNKDWDRRLPQGTELDGFLREIYANLAQERLFNQVMRPGDPTRGPLYNRLPITMTFEGDFLALARFLRRIDTMARLTRVEKLIIQPAGGGNELSIELGMNIYFTEY